MGKLLTRAAHMSQPSLNSHINHLDRFSSTTQNSEIIIRNSKVTPKSSITPTMLLRLLDGPRRSRDATEPQQQTEGNRLPDIHDCTNVSRRWEPHIKIWKGSAMRQTGTRDAKCMTHGTWKCPHNTWNFTSRSLARSEHLVSWEIFQVDRQYHTAVEFPRYNMRTTLLNSKWPWVATATLRWVLLRGKMIQSMLLGTTQRRRDVSNTNLFQQQNLRSTISLQMIRWACCSSTSA